PDEIKLQLTVRSYKPEVRKHLLASIERIVKGEAMAGGSPKEPLIKVTPAANATYNDPELTKREVGALKKILGDSNVVELPPKMGVRRLLGVLAGWRDCHDVLRGRRGTGEIRGGQAVRHGAPRAAFVILGAGS